ncbi:hypothetical protein HPP92_012125 [Vanilla planifolia]|uniref:Glucan endo-1,3-beta-D-glucosidase n=1 Tax=Vanilla planifolia TaxID=51239 RepID=A0A835R1X0_VANPL|nr:hypothetical protein HPP92_012125 [Vanilla planifolia]
MISIKLISFEKNTEMKKSTEMGSWLQLCFALPLLCFSGFYFFSGGAEGVGVNYGMLGDNLPSPSQVVSLYRSRNITKLRLFHPDDDVLSSLKNSGIAVILGTYNQDLPASPPIPPSPPLGSAPPSRLMPRQYPSVPSAPATKSSQETCPPPSSPPPVTSKRPLVPPASPSPSPPLSPPKYLPPLTLPPQGPSPPMRPR